MAEVHHAHICHWHPARKGSDFPWASDDSEGYGNHMDAFCYLTSLFNLQKPLFIDFWPLRSNAM